MRRCASLYIGLYRENAIAIESEDRDSLNVQSKADRRAFACKERNLYCDVHVAAENKRTLLPFESVDLFWIMRSQRSRRRDIGSFVLPICSLLIHII